MVAVEQLTSQNFPDLYAQLLSIEYPECRLDEWSSLFKYGWAQPRSQLGYVLMDDGAVVGVLGTAFSERIVDGRSHRFCNLHTWLVNAAHRGSSLALMRPVLRLTDHTITDFTPTRQVCDISKRLGFQSLDATLRILPPMRAKPSADGPHLIDDPAAIDAVLCDADQRIHHDHRALGCRHHLTVAGSDYCYLVYTLVTRHWLPYIYIHHVSNPTLFQDWNAWIRRHLLETNSARYIAVDARRVRHLRLPRSYTFPIASRQLFKSDRLRADQIDTLYSEVSIWNLCTLPDVRTMLRRCRRRFNPMRWRRRQQQPPAAERSGRVRRRPTAAASERT